MKICASFSFWRASWPTVGSSRTTTSGSQARMQARVSLFFSPPLRIEGRGLAVLLEPEEVERPVEPLRDQVLGEPEVPQREAHLVLDAVGEELVVRVLERYPDLAREGRRRRARACRRRPRAPTPLVGLRRPLVCLTRVVFPAPFSPTIATVSPFAYRQADVGERRHARLVDEGDVLELDDASEAVQLLGHLLGRLRERWAASSRPSTGRCRASRWAGRSPRTPRPAGRRGPRAGCRP